MNSNERPTTITIRDYYRQNFVLKVAKKECLVSVPGYAGSWIEDVEDAHGMYLIKFQDHDGVHSFNFAPDDKLTVTWLPIPPSRYADLLPQTVDTVRYGSEAFEQLSREDAEAEIARLQEEVNTLQSVLKDISSEYEKQISDIKTELDICRKLRNPYTQGKMQSVIHLDNVWVTGAKLEGGAISTLATKLTISSTEQNEKGDGYFVTGKLYVFEKSEPDHR